jgi:D-sedoheptulose 7-phosphate isomerase
MPESAGEGTAFLYPFIEGDERDAGSLLVDLGRSAVAKAETSAELRAVTLARTVDAVAAAADAMVEAFDGGGRLFTFGNGGSSTDAASLATLFARPPTGRALPARCLVDDTAVLTALGNDVGFELVFARQLIAHAAPGDVAVGFSTSGSSVNVLTAFAQARARRLVTVGLAGYDGGEMGASPDVQHCLVVASDSVHRIQETQAALSFALWEAVQQRLGRRGSAATDG